MRNSSLAKGVIMFPLLPFPYEHMVPISHVSTMMCGLLPLFAPIVLLFIVAMGFLDDRSEEERDDLRIAVRVYLSVMAIGAVILIIGAWMWIVFYTYIASAILYVFGNAIYRTFAPEPKHQEIERPSWSRVRFF